MRLSRTETTKVNEQLHRWIKTEAARRGVSFQEVLDELIRKGIEVEAQEGETPSPAKENNAAGRRS
jgi:hypothetical protein